MKAKNQGQKWSKERRRKFNMKKLGLTKHKPSTTTDQGEQIELTTVVQLAAVVQLALNDLRRAIG